MIPLPYLPTPVGVADVELAEESPRLAVDPAWRVLRLLVRLRGVPLGWVTLEDPPPLVGRERLREVVRRQLPAALLRGSLEQELAAPGPAAGDMPPISVIVCTRDRTASLRHCLDALLALDYPAFEILVVDNAPTSDATAELARTLPVRYVREDRPGLDWARNRGLAEARHALVAYTDDDVRVDRGWLRAIADAFADPAVAMVTGLIAPMELATPAQVTFEYSYGGMDKGCAPYRVEGGRAAAARLIGVHHFGAGANMAFRREVLERLGGFDTALDVGTPSHGAGDLDMFHRVVASGGHHCYVPAALVWHQHRRDPAALQRQLRDNGRAFGTYLLTRFLEGDRFGAGVTRGRVAAYAVRIWLGWMVGRVVRRFRRRETLALPFQLAELRGACEAPWAYVATRWSDRRLRRRFAGA